MPLLDEKYLRLDGSAVDVEVAAAPFVLGDKPAVQVILHDITERNRAVAALAETSGLLKALLENSPDKIYFKDHLSRFVQYSESFGRQFRSMFPDGLRGKTDFDIFTEEHARPAYEDELDIIRTGRPIIGKLEKETLADGRVTWALTTKMPWRGKDGNVIGTFGVSKDVTALKNVEESLERKNELLKTLLENIPDCIYFKDLESRFVHASKSKVQKTLERVPELRTRLAQQAGIQDPAMLGVGTDLLVGLTDFAIFTEEHARPAFQDEQEIIRTGKPIVGKLEKETHPDGQVSWSLSTKMPWEDKNGKIIGTFGISKDVTALKRAEAELENLHRRLVDTSRLAGMAEVASDVLHNVGNVLNSVNVSCDILVQHVQKHSYANIAKIPQLLLANAGRLDEFLTKDAQGKHIPEYLAALAQTLEDQKTEMLGEVKRLAEHISHIAQIVAMQQNYAKVVGLEEAIDVTQLVEDALHINAAALDRHVIEVRRELEPVPAVLVDKHKILQILVNLMRNAKYALSDSKRPDRIMTLRTRSNGDGFVEIQVVDNGIGISPENLTRIFAHGFTTRRDGHGFGLHSGALAAHDLGGTLTAHSDGVGKGATFTLSLPLKPTRKVQDE